MNDSGIVMGDTYQWACVRASRLKLEDEEAFRGVVGDLQRVRPMAHYRGVDGAPWMDFTPEQFDENAGALFQNSGGVYLDARGGGAEGRVSGWAPSVVRLRLSEHDVSRSEQRACLALYESLVQSTKCRLAAVGWGPSGERNEKGYRTWTSPESMAEYTFSMVAQEAGYARRAGLIGLSLRTYLGPHFAGLFDRGLLFDTPGKVTEVGEGVQIDVIDGDLVDAPFEALLRGWTRCMKHLRPAGVFAPLEVDESRKYMDVRRPGPSYRKPPKTKS